MGIALKDGVVLGAERRYAYGTLIQSHGIAKVFPITSSVGIASTGFYADLQQFVRLLKTYNTLYQLDEERELSAKSIAKVLSNALFSSRYWPQYVEPIIGGYDSSGSYLFALGPWGSIMEDTFAATGTGAMVALGILEEGYRETLSIKKGEELAVRAITSVVRRDAASGEGADFLTITRNKVNQFQKIPLE